MAASRSSVEGRSPTQSLRSSLPCLNSSDANLLPQVVTTFEANSMQTVTLVVLIGAMAYTTAFMETFTISGFPYYTFEDRNMMYVIGSAFYGIYFIVR